MAIVSNNIKFYLSGGVNNTEVNDSLGGVMSTTEVVDSNLHNLFDKTLGTESTAGDTEYRCIYVKNTHASLELELAKIWISSNSVNPANAIWIARDVIGKNGEAETETNENTAPSNSGTTFSQTALQTGTYAGGLSLDGLATGTAVLTSQALSSITITDGGSNYSSAPTITITGGGGSSATATATLTSGKVSSISITAGGSSYTSVPTVTFSGGGSGTGLGAGLEYPIWIKRVIAAGATAVDDVTFILSVQGDTAA